MSEARVDVPGFIQKNESSLKDIPAEIVDEAARVDPTSAVSNDVVVAVGSYTLPLAHMWKRKGIVLSPETRDDNRKIIAAFHQGKQKLANKDISQYKTIDDVKNVAFTAVAKTNTSVNPVVFEDDGIVVREVNDYDFSVRFCGGYGWCTTNQNDRSYFDAYKKNGHLFIILWKKKEFPDDKSYLYMTDEGKEHPFRGGISEYVGYQNKVRNMSELFDKHPGFKEKVAEISHRNPNEPGMSGRYSFEDLPERTRDWLIQDLEHDFEYDVLDNLRVFNDFYNYFPRDVFHHKMFDVKETDDKKTVLNPEYFDDWKKVAMAGARIPESLRPYVSFDIVNPGEFTGDNDEEENIEDYPVVNNFRFKREDIEQLKFNLEDEANPYKQTLSAKKVLSLVKKSGAADQWEKRLNEFFEGINGDIASSEDYYNSDEYAEQHYADHWFDAEGNLLDY